MSCKHACFPDLSFLQFPVTKQCIHSIVSVSEFCTERHSDRTGNALAKRSRRHINSRAVLHARMPLKSGIHLPKRRKFLLWKITTLGKNRIISRCDVAFGKHKMISLLFVRLGRINIHFSKVQTDKNLYR